MHDEKNKIFIRYIFSSIVSTFGFSCYVLADTVFLAMISERAIAALNIVLPVYELMMAFGAMISVGASTLFAIHRAQNHFEEGSRCFSHAMVIGIVFTQLAAILFMIFHEPVLMMLGANVETLKLATDYLFGYMSLAIFNTIGMIVTSFIRCDGDPKLASFASLVGSLSNILLDAIFIFVFKWGMFGAAFATSMSPIVTLIICSWYFIEKANGFHFIKEKLSMKRSFEIIKLGFPALISGFANGFTMLVFNQQLLNLGGNIALTAYGIIVNLGVFINCLRSGITQGVGPLFSHSYGKKDRCSLNHYVKLTIFAIMISFVLSYGMVLLVPDLLIGIFNPEKDRILNEMTKIGMFIYFSGSFFIGITQFLNTYFISVKCPLPSTVLSILQGGLVITPVVLVLPLFFDLFGVWMSYPVANFIIMIIAIGLYFLNYKKIMKFAE